MKSHRSQLVLSHLLPLLILIPALGILLAYIVETQVLLANLSADLGREAKVLAEIASQQQSIFVDPAQGDFFARAGGAQYERNVALYRADGSEWIVIPEANAQPAPNPTAQELVVLADGEMEARTTYHVDPAQAHAEVLVPVLDAQKRLVGIVRVSEHLDRLNARLTQMRVLILGSTLAALLVAMGVGAYLASRTANRLEAVTDALGHVARGTRVPPVEGAMPREFRATFDAVTDLQSRLNESETARKRLLANLVHELGRPLAALQAAIHALMQGADDDPVLRQELLGGMDAQVERLKPLLDNLASLHGGLSGAMELRRAPVSLSDWLPRVASTWREAAEQKKLKWAQEIPENLPPVSIDADRMAQVVGNLVSNAIKYTPEGGGEIVLRASASRDEMRVEVQDSGIGISHADLPHIFDPFYRGQNARFPQGLGLGLAIARDVVNAHGGRIEVESESGKGSKFAVVLQK